MSTQKADFETTLTKLLNRLADVNYLERADRLGAGSDQEALLIRFYGQVYRVLPKGVTDMGGKRVNAAVGVVLCRYALECPDETPMGKSLISFREFADAGPLSGYFVENTQKTIVNTFGGNLDGLDAACRKLGGVKDTGEAAFDLSICFAALPRVPLYLRFNDRDQTFPAQCSILFQQTAQNYLDLESLTMVATFLTGNLIR